VSTADVVVVGLGGVGSAAAAALARRGALVVGLDRHPPVHDRGASHGGTRIVRKAYFEGAAYVPLLRRAEQLWEELGLLHRCGGLFLGAHGSRVLAGSLATAQQHDLPHELLEAADVTARYPAMTPPPGTVGLLEPDAGWVSPELAVRTQLDRAAVAGADLRHGIAVERWTAGPDGVRVETSDGVVEADALVVAPGREAPQLLGDLPVRFDDQPRVQHWYAPRPADRDLPVWIWERDDGTSPYGVPDVGQGPKVAVHHSAVRPPGDWSADEVRELVAPLLPGLGEPVRSAPCRYVMTPDEHAAVGRHPDSDRVVVAAGFSGHGFKLTPVLGELLADLALDGSTGWDLGLFDPQRARFSPSGASGT
jgi:sarcosine oxidase